MSKIPSPDVLPTVERGDLDLDHEYRDVVADGAAARRDALERQPAAVCAAVSPRTSASSAATSAVVSVRCGAPASVSPSV